MDRQDQSGDSCALDIASLAHKLREELELATQNSRTAQLDAGWPPRRCIIVAKVHNLTRNVDESEYDPHYVSIGPYHYPRPQSKNLHLAREDDKLRSLDYVLSAAKAVKPSMTVEIYLEEMARLERCARRCYAQTFGDMTSEMFVRMLLLDGCYILSRFGDIKAHPTNGAMKDDGCVPSVSPTAGSDMLEIVSVVRDVFYLAENQIPFFVLEKIDQLTTLVGHASAVNGISRYALELLETQQYAVASPAMVAPMPAVPGNLLHLLHMQLQATAISSAMGSGERDGKFVGRWRTATEYYFAGVKFKRRGISKRGNVRCILDVKLDSGSGTLEIPCLNIDSETWRLLRNLMELEQRNPKEVGSRFTAYCVFMSQLACTERDVELLSRRGVIVHGLGTDGDVAKFFANLCKGIVFDPDNPGFNYLRATCQELEKRFRSNPRRWMAWLRRKYFSNPWLAVGLLAAAIGLVCTVVQAAYSVLSYKGHP